MDYQGDGTVINKYKQILSKIGKCSGYGLLLGAIALIAYIGYSMAAFFVTWIYRKAIGAWKVTRELLLKNQPVMAEYLSIRELFRD